MLLAIDIGNTNINAAFFKGKRLVKRFLLGDSDCTCHSMGTVLDSLHSDRKRTVPRLCSRGRELSPSEIIVASVAPKKLNKVLSNLKTNFGSRIPIYVVGKNLKVPLKSLYDPRQIGQDRLVSAYAASELFGFPVLTVDFGTAVTFDVVSASRVYLGGLILPGIKMSLESIHNKTALLPEVEFKKAKGFIGTNTQDSIRNGMIYGYASICEGLISKFRKKFKNLKVVATGGDAKLISRYTKSISHVEPDLCLKGLSLLKTP